MKLYFALIVLFSTFIVLINSQYVLIEQFEYLGDSCSSSSASSSQNSIGSSSDSFSSWGSSSGSNELKLTTSSSNSDQDCVASNLLGGQIIKENTCLIAGDKPTTFTVSADGTSIIQSIYNETDYECQGNAVYQLKSLSGECYSGCVDGSAGLTYQVSSINTIPNIPNTNTIIEVAYTGQCNGNYKDNFLAIYYKSVDVCNGNVNTQYGVLSTQITCNSQNSTISVYDNSNCSGTPIYAQSEHLTNSCGQVNVIEVCYN